uniref:Chemokine interleukin-8-like domain-containing protein n=1 Tax=Prolemur simus TaxID=1328070 RepID=A0A8C9ADP1_PROSS
MQVPVAALAVLFFTEALYPQTCSASSGTPTACCFSYISRQLPLKFVDDYSETSRPVFLFLTKRARQVCADPSEAWVQEYVTNLELNA